MTSINDPLLCYADDVDDRFRTYYLDLNAREATSLGAETVLDQLVEEDWPRKLSMLDGIFKDRWNAPNVSFVYDVRYLGCPNERHLYDILFLPSFTKPAYKLSLSVKGDHLRRLDGFVYTAKEFSPMSPSLYCARFQILADDYAASRLSGMEILKDRLSSDGFESWLKEAAFD